MTDPATEQLSADANGLSRAAAILQAGGRVAFPTETVYGLGADATNDRAVAGIFAAKGRPSFNPLIVHVPDVAAAERIVSFNDAAHALGAAFWPGALTLVLPLRADSGIAPLVTAGLPTLAVRVPDHPLARDLLRAAGRPIAAPSANPSGRISATEADHVLLRLSGRIEAVLDGGPCPVGLESTILGFDPVPTLLRTGGLPAEAIEAALGRPLARDLTPAEVQAPGQLASHYAPKGQLRLDVIDPEPGETLLGFGDVGSDYNLSRAGDLTEAAANLFRALHQMDAIGADRIAVSPIPDHGLGRAINDRLRRAAAPRNR